MLDDSSSAFSDDYDDYGVDDQAAIKAGDKGNNLAVANALRAAVGEAERTKKRRPVAKLDFERLMGERGFRYLRERFRELQFSGHTESDLSALMRLYKEWADFMFPKLPFADVLKRIERISKTHRSMRIYGRALKDALSAGRDFDEAAFLTGMALDEGDAMVNESPLAVEE